MKRREFIGLFGCAAAANAWVGAARAQQPDQVRRVGLLSNLAENDQEAVAAVAALHQTLQDSGWVDGRNVRFDYRWAGGETSRLRAFAKELAGLQPEVIVGHNTPAVIALRKVTDTIPIVFVQVTDPIGSGLITSLPHPGGNMTGFVTYDASMSGKWVEILKEVAPGVIRVALIFNPESAAFVPRFFQRPFEIAAPLLRVQPSAAPVHSDVEIENAMTALGREPGGGLIVMPESFANVHRGRIISLAARLRLPTIYVWRYAVEEGGLISYGVDQVDLFRRAAGYVDRILRGDKPADLPVQAPIKFELAINLKTAKALGLTVTPSLLAIADEVIE
jgi:putative tryptophan/tyrosine transport system substrate-binding protein